MKHAGPLTHEFVEYIPDRPEEGTLYVSVAYATVIHKCCCGCGNEVVTPLSPRDWKLTFDGETISLHPSIGNWGFPCQSHYWIRGNRVVWAPRWSTEEIEAARSDDRKRREDRDEETHESGNEATVAGVPEMPDARESGAGIWKRFKAWLSRLRKHS